MARRKSRSKSVRKPKAKTASKKESPKKVEEKVPEEKAPVVEVVEEPKVSPNMIKVVELHENLSDQIMTGIQRVSKQTSEIKRAILVQEKDVYKTHSFNELCMLRKKFIQKVDFAKNLLDSIE